MKSSINDTEENEVTVKRLLYSAFDAECGCCCYVSKVVPVINFIDTSKSISTIELTIGDWCGKQHIPGLMSEKFYLSAYEFMENIHNQWGTTKLIYNTARTLQLKVSMRDKDEINLV